MYPYLKCPSFASKQVLIHKEAFPSKEQSSCIEILLSLLELTDECLYTLSLSLQMCSKYETDLRLMTGSHNSQLTTCLSNS
jgi:hypothetical protein